MITRINSSENDCQPYKKSSLYQRWSLKQFEHLRDVWIIMKLHCKRSRKAVLKNHEESVVCTRYEITVYDPVYERSNIFLIFVDFFLHDLLSNSSKNFKSLNFFRKTFLDLLQCNFIMIQTSLRWYNEDFNMTDNHFPNY